MGSNLSQRPRLSSNRFPSNLLMKSCLARPIYRVSSMKRAIHQRTYTYTKNSGRERETYIYMYREHIHICCGVIIWAKFVLLRCHYLGQVCFFTKHCLSIKHYKHRGFSAFFEKQNCARKFEVSLSGPSWPFLSCNQLGPDNDTYLAQIITPQNGFSFSIFCF